MKIKSTARYFLAGIVAIFAILMILSLTIYALTPEPELPSNYTYKNHTHNYTKSYNSDYSHGNYGYHNDGPGEDDIEFWFEENADYIDSAGADYEGYYDDEDYLD